MFVSLDPESNCRCRVIAGALFVEEVEMMLSIVSDGQSYVSRISYLILCHNLIPPLTTHPANLIPPPLRTSIRLALHRLLTLRRLLNALKHALLVRRPLNPLHHALVRKRPMQRAIHRRGNREARQKRYLPPSARRQRGGEGHTWYIRVSSTAMALSSVTAPTKPGMFGTTPHAHCARRVG